MIVESMLVSVIIAVIILAFVTIKREDMTWGEIFLSFVLIGVAVWLLKGWY